MTEREILDLFEKKFNRLENSSLIKFLTQDGMKISFDLVKNQMTEKAVIPELELLENYILNLRFFIQDGDGISVKKMQEFYQQYCTNEKYINEFNNARLAFNKALDTPFPFGINNLKLTYRNIFNGKIYGEIAHSNSKDHPAYFEAIRSEFGNALVYQGFMNCIYVIHRVLREIYNLNQKAFS